MLARDSPRPLPPHAPQMLLPHASSFFHKFHHSTTARALILAHTATRRGTRASIHHLQRASGGLCLAFRLLKIRHVICHPTALSGQNGARAEVCDTAAPNEAERSTCARACTAYTHLIPCSLRSQFRRSSSMRVKIRWRSTSHSWRACTRKSACHCAEVHTRWHADQRARGRRRLR